MTQLDSLPGQTIYFRVTLFQGPTFTSCDKSRLPVPVPYPNLRYHGPRNHFLSENESSHPIWIPILWSPFPILLFHCHPQG